VKSLSVDSSRFQKLIGLILILVGIPLLYIIVGFPFICLGLSFIITPKTPGWENDIVRVKKRKVRGLVILIVGLICLIGGIMLGISTNWTSSMSAYGYLLLIPTGILFAITGLVLVIYIYSLRLTGKEAILKESTPAIPLKELTSPDEILPPTEIYEEVKKKNLISGIIIAGLISFFFYLFLPYRVVFSGDIQMIIGLIIGVYFALKNKRNYLKLNSEIKTGLLVGILGGLLSAISIGLYQWIVIISIYGFLIISLLYSLTVLIIEGLVLGLAVGYLIGFYFDRKSKS
jgi:hypothetical protein